jgi:L-fuculose-phosphate aldolase
MNEQTAKELVLRAGLELVKTGLIVRTWGNVSCRADEKNFFVTPTGRSYETLKPEEIVLCKIEDASYEGDIKPSSEKGIHALLYRTHPDVNFVIHTHQPMASVISASGLDSMPAPGFPLFEGGVPVAEYGLPGTKKLREGVGRALERCQGHAIVMAHHGALCFGRDYDEAFSAAKQLEDACRAFVHSYYFKKSGAAAFDEREFNSFYISQILGQNLPLPENPLSLYSSRRTPEGFVLEGERETAYRFADGNMPYEALVHRAVYQNRRDINFIIQDTGIGLIAVSLTSAPLRPLLDDFAQIVGRSAWCAKGTTPGQILHALGGRLGVLVPGAGALCCAATETDANAVRLVMEKGALAQIGTQLFGGGKAIGLVDCLLMHFIYTQSYAKKAKSGSATV